MEEEKDAAIDALSGSVGMYGETPRVAVGKYTICRQDENSVWIGHESGEGGQFSDDLFEKAVELFYRKHF